MTPRWKPPEFINENIGCILVLVGSLVFVAGFDESPTWWMVVGAAGATIVILAYAFERWQDRKWRQRPCIHGVPGAVETPSVCRTCKADAFERQRVDVAAKAAAALREQERQRVAAQDARQRREAHLREIRKKDYLQKMHPREFERLVWEVYRKLGYRVEGTAYSGDSGVDGYLYKAGATYILQCKRVHGAVGEPVVRDLFGTLSHEGAAGGILVTTGTVSAKAREWATGKPFEFVELDQIVQMIETTHPLDAAPWSAEAEAPDVASEGVGAGGVPYLCPTCGSPLREVHGRHGRFLGCTRYPECRFTHSLTSKGKRRRHRH